MISSILAGYAWDESNPYVAQSERRFKTIGRVMSVKLMLTAFLFMLVFMLSGCSSNSKCWR